MRLGFVLRAGLLACATIATGAIGLAGPARAQIGSDRYAAIVLDARSGAVLAGANADETRHPASLTKMMTLYMAFEALREGRLSLDSRVTMSEEAASRPPSKLGIPAGQSITAEQAILALVTRSANDVAAALGERLGGSEERFAQMMTLRARALGMTRTTFRNASGLPNPDQVTTARDMATLGRRLFQDFPERYHYFGVTHAQFGGMRIRNHNRMLETYEGVDGIKTGFINASGFNIVTSASRGGQRLVGAVFGGSSWVERDQHMASLLDRGFEQLGVAVRDGRDGPLLVRTAQASSLPRAGASAAARAQAPSRTAPRTVSRTASRQGDTTRAAQAQAPSRAARARPVADERPARRVVRQASAAQPVRGASASRQAAQPTRVAQAQRQAQRQATRQAAQPARAAARPTPARAAAQPARPVQAAPTLPLAPPPRNLGTIRTAELH